MTPIVLGVSEGGWRVERADGGVQPWCWGLAKSAVGPGVARNAQESAER